MSKREKSDNPANLELRNPKAPDKYGNRLKAEEYALMSYSEVAAFPEAAPFYDRLSTDIVRIASRLPQDPRVIEIGFGAGRFIADIAKTRPDARVDGYEYSKAMQGIATELVIDTDDVVLNGVTVKGKGLKNVSLHADTDVQDLDGISDEAADLTVCVNVLDRVPDTGKAISELARIVKKNGVLYLVTACDYEDYTPIEERLTAVQIQEELQKLGFEVAEPERLELHKKTADGTERTFEEHLLVAKKKEGQGRTLERRKFELPVVNEVDNRFSREHNVTIHFDGTNITARQINNAVPLSDQQIANLRSLFTESKGARVINVAPGSMAEFEQGNLTLENVVFNPANFIFVSSYGLLNDAKWTSNRPSEGMYVIAEDLTRNVPGATAMCLDPNMFGSLDEFIQALSRFADDTPNTVIGFSVLPVNLRNDAKAICKVQEAFPNAIKVAGGIGSDSLDLLPTKSGKKGITHALPLELVIQGVSVLEMRAIADAIKQGEIRSKDDLATWADRYNLKGLYDNVDGYLIQRRILQARETVKAKFIPQNHRDIVHPRSYTEANKDAVEGRTHSIVDLLTDNQCEQGCSFCAVPKYKVFASREEELAYILEVSRSGQILAFNNNDLANDPKKTIWLCEQMQQAGRNQPKHGKMRIISYKPDLIKALSDANFVRMAVGVESFSSEVRSRLSKKDFIDDAIRATLEEMIRLGIIPEINLMLFNQHDTIDTLRQTVVESLKWLEKGATIYATFGVFATPNSPSVHRLLEQERLSVIQEKIHLEEIYLPGMKEALLYPTQWKAGQPDVEELRARVARKRLDVLEGLEDRHGKAASVPSEAYTAIALLAHEFGLDGFVDEEEARQKIEKYYLQMLDKEYISI